MRPFHLTDRTYLRYLALIWLTIFAFNPGKLEGYFFPVIQRAEITKVEPDVYTADVSHIWGKSTLYRENCSFRFVRWYLGDRGHIDAPARIDTGPPVVRRNGPFDFGPWILGMSPRDIAKNSYADIFHRCKYMGVQAPWLTKTQLWN